MGERIMNKGKPNSYPPKGGPSIAAPALWGGPTNGKTGQLLTDEKRAQIAVISSVVRFRRGEKIYGEGDRADAIFNINCRRGEVLQVSAG